MCKWGEGEARAAHLLLGRRQLAPERHLLLLGLGLLKWGREREREG